ncbi:MAG: ABC transporter ATP-binding protein [Oscillospiraceae bacterium]|nr:ABC transporter ATP-binding protein [Oscillospiraceae bacterium]
MSYISVQDVTKTYKQKGRDFQALNHVSLDIDKGEFICLLGPSGCGKTTLLNAIAGFEKPDSGTITVDGDVVKKPVPNRVTVFQHYGLLPWQTVEKNVMFGLDAQGVPKEEAKKRADHFIELVGLSKFAQHRPSQLSGGMQQRVSIARALAVDPEVLFMDEPFGALDAITRIKLQDDLLHIVKTQHKTVIFVTHDIEEAVYLADRIVVMTPNPGRIKTILPVMLGQDRDRTRDDFLQVRDHVFEAFEMKHEDPTEYYI